MTDPRALLVDRDAHRRPDLYPVLRLAGDPRHKKAPDVIVAKLLVESAWET